MIRPPFGTLALAVILAGAGGAQVTQRVSVASTGAQGNGESGGSSISADGRYVAFSSSASNLVAGDTNAVQDVFVHDRQSGQTSRASVDSSGAQGNGMSYGPSISADGRFVAFVSDATNLVAGDTNAWTDVFVHDLQTGQTDRVSVGPLGVEANWFSLPLPSISADGRYVAFSSIASNLIAGDVNNTYDVFVHDRSTGTTTCVSFDPNFSMGSRQPSISADGRWVAFESESPNLVTGDTNGWGDVFVYDRESGQTSRVSVSSTGQQANSFSVTPSISADGQVVAFQSLASNLVPGDTDGAYDLFVYDRSNAQTTRVSVSSAGAQANAASESPWISADGRYVSFSSTATNLVTGDTNFARDIFVHDRQSGATTRASLSFTGGEAGIDSQSPSSSADGRFVAFESLARNLVPGDTNGHEDVFVRDRSASGFTSLCDPGVFGVIACPCSNAPSGPGRGCDNSSSTGGSVIAASGAAYLSMDSLVFTTSGEKPSATSIVMQGTALAAGGLAFGQGVRCVDGTLKRLYTKTAVGGSITAPDFGAGDATVSTRSATLGDVIQPGQSRWYLIYYRDPIILGGCPASSTFNATQTGEVAWSL